LPVAGRQLQIDCELCSGEVGSSPLRDASIHQFTWFGGSLKDQHEMPRGPARHETHSAAIVANRSDDHTLVQFGASVQSARASDRRDREADYRSANRAIPFRATFRASFRANVRRACGVREI
jgi:hypothetical protein